MFRPTSNNNTNNNTNSPLTAATIHLWGRKQYRSKTDTETIIATPVPVSPQHENLAQPYQFSFGYALDTNQRSKISDVSISAPTI